ncbi:bifunctional (p)ppGpp synthetase/guanosine-3',5'-bis(diphosphate) 3'-pyrophosphohydrolase [Candidatus Woesearchaeota archaeon]|nr:bifunctional (p)ppGpp synthetase/guanosine-3',5'-bis(diphosphate) 3'-pyrophosphohydrolase [Candidatus Woesearchaeota archaeon]
MALHIKQIIRKVKGYAPEADFELIKKAFEFASEVHKDQKRASGEPFIQHALETAYILTGLKQDPTSITAALLHDVLETSKVDLEELKQKFGEEVAMLVDGVTKLSSIKYHDRQERDAESIRKMFLATTKDIRVLIIKLADKIHNMRTLSYLTEEQQKRISQATLDIYAPLAYRLGIASIKWELEDIAFKYLHPDMYAKFREKFGKKRLHREIEIRKLIKVVEKALKKANITAKVTGRPKHFYSIYKKMLEKKRTFEELYDLAGLRIITDTTQHCYEILGIIHSMWKPIPGEFDDYIAMPKANMYQSLHTAVIGPNGQPIEIQIRTEEMHTISEEGVAAHWDYKGVKIDDVFDKKVSWLRQILDWQRESKTTKEFMDFLKIDLFQDEIYVFTPKGKVICLPKGSTPIDFAYKIHSDIGDTCTGAIVNGRIVPLRYELKNGDIINITTAKNQTPKRDWLKIVKTTEAKTRIRHYLKETEELPISYRSVNKQEKKVVKGDIIEVEPSVKAPLIKLAKCCHPLPGDHITGFLTTQNHVVIHRKDCESANETTGRKRLEVKWKKDFNQETEVKIFATDRVGLFADVLNTIAATGTNIMHAKGKTITESLVEIDFIMIPENLDHLQDIIRRIQRLQNVSRIAIEVAEPGQHKDF